MADQVLNALVTTILTAISTAVVTLWAWILSWATTSSNKDDKEQEEDFTWDDIANQLEVPLDAPKPKILSKGLDFSRVVKRRN